MPSGVTDTYKSDSLSANSVNADRELAHLQKKGAGFMLAPYFFHKTRVQKSDKEICTLFFSFVPPRIAQEGRL